MSEPSTTYGRDTGPLEPSQLSKTELEIIHKIEQRLGEPRPNPPHDRKCGSSFDRSSPYLAVAEKRGPQVLLLDGGRGTGKTSLMLTLVERWHCALNDDSDAQERLRVLEDGYPAQIKAFELALSSCKIPQNIRVLAVLDFDPLPPSVPLIAGIVEAWRPIAKRYDDENGCAETDSGEEDSLMDRWHALFRMAATGWSASSQGKNLLEQVLDREEQVEDWQQLSRNWRGFVDKLVKRGKKSKGQALPKDTVFVLMIDDVDLQVERIRELLPALRVLYHPNVFFLVAADRDHMLYMLKLDFYGQQLKLAGRKPLDHAPELGEPDLNWAEELAAASFEKVFPSANSWKLKRLTLEEVLSFPSASRSIGVKSSSIGSQLERLPWSRKGNGANSSNVFAQIEELRSAIDSTSTDLPGIMTYRAAEHLWQYSISISNESLAPAEILARLMAGNGHSQQAIVKGGGERIQLEAIGDLAALYQPGLNIEGGVYNVVFGGRVDFVFRRPEDRIPLRMSAAPENRFNFVGALIAKMLQEEGFPVDATGLRWETYLSHAWTEWRLLPYSFAWNRHKHPKPQELFRNTSQWNRFIEIGSQNNYKVEHFAFGWLYYQRCWNDTSFDASCADLSKPLGLEELPWDNVLDFSSAEDASEAETWNKRTLPLLARPELGFPPTVQGRLLRNVSNDEEISLLWEERRRFFTDAFFAAEAQDGKLSQNHPTDEKIEADIKAIDKAFARVHKGENAWAKLVEKSQP